MQALGIRGGALLLTALMVFSASPAAAAAAATRGYVANLRDDTLVVFDPATNTVTNTVQLGISTLFEDFAVRPDGREIYVPDYWGDTIVVVSTANHSVVARIPVGKHPAGVVFTPDNRRAYVSSDLAQTISVIDTTTRQVSKVIPIGAQAHEPSISLDGAFVYAGTDAASGTVSRKVAVIDTATNRHVKTIPLADNNRTPSRVVFAPNGQFALVNTGDLIDTRTQTLIRRLRVAPFSDQFAFTPDSTSVYVANACDPFDVGTVRLVDIRTDTVTRTIIEGRTPTGVTLTPDNERLYVTMGGGRSIAVVDPDTGRFLDEFGGADPGSRPWLHGVQFSTTAPAASQPGRRFEPAPRDPNICLI